VLFGSSEKANTRKGLIGPVIYGKHEFHVAQLSKGGIRARQIAWTAHALAVVLCGLDHKFVYRFSKNVHFDCS